MASEPVNVETSLDAQRSDARADTDIGRLVIDQKLATTEEVQTCQARKRKLKASGNDVALGDLLVKYGVVTSSQLKRLSSVSDDSMTRPIQQIPGFQIMRKVGAGAMATVYKAKQLSLDRIVAIKVLPKRLSENPEFVSRFYKEGRAAAKLNHNNIVQAIDVGENAGYHYFVMEFVDGVTVYDELSKHRVYDEKKALDVVIQVARALEHAHARGFIHRDVKPKNIMITADATAKLADMGLAREASDQTAAAEEAGRAYGTPYYLSPEQIRGEVNIDFGTDIYSLGATFYHMVTGRVPFDGATPAAVMHKHLKEPLTPPDHVNSALSTGLAEAIERMMAKDRNRRYRSTTDLLVDLERITRGEAPLEARTGYASDLLKNLADGSHHEEGSARAMIGPAVASNAANVPLIIGLVAICLAEFLIILLLLLR
jgi:serine/threonine-protein kinase